jgi:uncharacterized protein (TIGR00369 family)
VTTTPLDRLRAATGSAPVPVAVGLGIAIEEVDEGRMVARLAEPAPSGLRGPGPALVMMDMVLSAVVATVLPAERAISTLTLHWAGTGPFPDATGPLVGVGTVVHVTDDSALSTGQLLDGDGGVVATVANRSALLPRPAGWDGGWAAADAPDGPPGFAALGLTGTAPRWTGVGAASLSNTAGAVQGGVVAAVTAHVLDEVIGAARPHLAGATVDLDVTYLRPVPADGSGFAVTAEPVHTGSRLSAARAEVRDSAGKLAIVASATHWRGTPPP